MFLSILSSLSTLRLKHVKNMVSVVSGDAQQGGKAMLKATLRSAVLLGLLVWSIPSYAEVQNIKVSGDTTTRAFMRKNLDLNRNDSVTNRHSRFLMQTTGINVEADLTENVSAHVRVANERDWNTASTADGGADEHGGDIKLSQAYVTLKELFYSPLTLRVGTQPIVWGRGFVLGSNLIPGTVLRGGDAQRSISADEFTDYTAFDAIRGTLDLSGVGGLGIPLTIDGVYIKLSDRNVQIGDDLNLMGVNFSTKFDNSEAEAYFLNKRDGQLGTSPVTDNNGNLNTWGIRGSTKPVEGSDLWGELAYQQGTRTQDPDGLRVQGEHVSAWAADFGGRYTLTDVAMKPGLGLEWVFWSGKNKSDGVSTTGAQAGWDPIARGYFTTAIREFQTRNGSSFFYPVAQNNVTAAVTNQHQLAVFGDLDPIEDLHVNSRFTWFVADVPMVTRADNATSGSNKGRNSFIGTEWDTQLTYNYTDDVQFGVFHALFAPGNVFRTPNDDTAQEVITWAKVTF